MKPLSLVMLIACFCVAQIQAQAVDLRSVRLSFSKPQTVHSLIFNPSDQTKVNYELSPVNNERVGVFVDLYGVEIGYAVDFIDDEVQTKTEDFLFSYKKRSNSIVTLNYQVLEGLDADALNILDESQSASQFLPDTKSTKIEILGLHDVYQFFGDTLFDHFFLKRPKGSNRYEVGVSLLAGWSYKHLELTSPTEILKQPEFAIDTVPSISKLTADSFDVSAGPLVSFAFENNVHAFAEARFGKGFVKNEDDNNLFKQTGNQNIYTFGAGASWTNQEEDTILMLRGWVQRSRHIETVFGDASLIYYF